MKLGQLIDYNKRNNSLQTLYRKWGRKASPRPLCIFRKSLKGRRKTSATFNMFQ